MLKAGSQSSRSTNWNSAVPGTKSSHSSRLTRNVPVETHNATQRELRAVSSSLPRIISRHSTPASGRKIVRERSGNAFMAVRFPYQTARTRNQVASATRPIIIAKA